MADGKSPRWRVSISLALALGFGLMMVLGGVAFGYAMLSGRANLVDLLRDRNQRIIDQVVERARMRLDPVRLQAEALRDRIVAGRLSINDRERLGDYLSAILESSPQIDAVGVVRTDFSASRAFRSPSGLLVAHDAEFKFPNLQERMQEVRRLVDSLIRSGQNPNVTVWGDLIWEPTIRQPLINLRAPLVVNGEFVGALATLASLGTLSKFLEESSRDGHGMSFILYDERYVLGHPTLTDHDYHLSVEKPLPLLEEIDDPILARIWNGRIDTAPTRALFAGGRGHLVEAEGRRWIFLYRQIDGYGERPWLVGRYFPFDDIEEEVGRLQRAAAVGGVVLLLALLIALRMGRAIAIPVRALGEAANRMRRLEFAGTKLPGLHLRELDEASEAFNSAAAALTWFGNYVPRKLVDRLLSEGDGAVNQSKHRDVTVLFTDIVGFTALSETMPAEETAALLNQHFELAARCIEAEGGIIDKFIGDSVMAVWGGIRRDEDHAARACRAALRLGQALAEDNDQRAAAGLPRLRVRAGLHSGPVVVGNIGAPGRINYTVVGDTVNIAQRLEQLGRDYMDLEHCFVALASAETVAAASLDPMPPPIGPLPVKGREVPVGVFRLTRC